MRAEHRQSRSTNPLGASQGNAALELLTERSRERRLPGSDPQRSDPRRDVYGAPGPGLLPFHVARHAEDALPGTTALMGGAIHSAEILAALRTAACGEVCEVGERPRIGVVVSSKASAEAARKAVFEDTYRDGKVVDDSIEHWFQKFGFEPVFIPLTVDNHETASRDPKLVELIDTLDAVYLCGGDQAKHVHCLLGEDGQDTPVMAAIRRVRERGGVVSGSSAGAAAQGAIQYGVGRSYEYLVENELDVRDIGEGTLQDPKNGDLGSLGLGLGLIGKFGAIVCTHFDESYRLGRLMVALKEAERAGAPRPIGLGIDEDTAILVRGDVGKVCGAGGVFIVDASHADFGDGASFEAQNIRVHHLTAGDAYDFAKHEVIPADGGEKRGQRSARALVSRDFLAPREASKLIAGLIETRAEKAVGYSKQKDPQFIFTLTKDENTRTWRRDDGGAIAGLRIDVSVNA